ncbi:hypothetical protein ACNFG0_15980 [Pseudomonas sp. NY15372]|uniref:hypothetical protein n=1 Tax=Pseudomonas sp. NY15372 TaxID=3400356 RepID=UPI003A87C2F8
MLESQKDVVVSKLRSPHFTISLLLLFALPNLLFVSMGFTSLAPGLLLACTAILLVNFRDLFKFRFSTNGFLMFFAMFVCAFIFGAHIYLSSGENKSLISLLFFFVIAVSVVLGNSVINVGFYAFNRTLVFVLTLLLILGWVKLFWQPDFLRYGEYSKPVFPFSEESHYSLFLGMIACGVIVNLSAIASAILIVNMLALAILMPNLTLLVFVCMCSLLLLLRVRLIYFWVVLIVVASILGFFFYFVLLDNEYFKSRLDFSGSENLTALVFLQGWALAYANFTGTFGLGLGFQMLGSSYTFLPEISEVIYRHAGQYFNVADAGFLAAKLIAELGVLGLLLSAAYLVLLVRVIFVINHWSRRSKKMRGTDCLLAKKYVAASALVFGFLVEFFFRGLGYFSPGVFLFLFAFTIYLKSKALLREI